MTIWNKLKKVGKNKNNIDTITVRELQGEQLLLKDRTETMRKEIMKIEEEKKKKFMEGIGADNFVKRMLASDIKGLETEAKLKSKSFLMAQKQYQFTTNFLTIKKFEKQLKNTPVWDKITSADTKELEKVMLNVQLDNMEYDDLLNNLNNVFERDIASFDGFEDASTESIVDMMKQVEGGSLDVETVNKELSVEKSMKE